MSGCALQHPEAAFNENTQKTTQKPMVDGLDPALTKEFYPSYSFNLLKLRRDSNDNEHPRFDINVRKMRADKFFTKLIDQTSYGVTVEKNLTGLITLNIENITIDAVMQTVREIYGYDYELHGNHYTIFANHPEERIYQVEVLNQDEDRFWKTIQRDLWMIIGSGKNRRITINRKRGTIVVMASPSELVSVQDFLSKTQDTLQRQIIIDASFITVQLSQRRHNGIDWEEILNNSLFDKNSSQLPQEQTTTDQDQMVFLSTLPHTPFEQVIEQLKTQGDLRFISNPRFTTSNNRSIVIKSLEKEITKPKNKNQPSTANDFSFELLPMVDQKNHLTLNVRPSLEGQFRQLKLNMSVSNSREKRKISPFLLGGSEQMNLSSDQILLIGGVRIDNNRPKSHQNEDPMLKNNSNSNELVVLLQTKIIDHRNRDWGAPLRSGTVATNDTSK